MNIWKIAEIAGVSKSTVSGVLRGRPGFAEATRERILRIARDLGYQAHGGAAALSSGRFNVLGILPNAAAPFCISVWDRAVLEGFVQTAAENGKQTMLMSEVVPSDVSQGPVPRYVDGAAFMIRPQSATTTRLTSQSIPCVAINLDLRHIPPMDLVYPDDASGMEQAVRYLASLGHRRIAYVNAYSPRPDQHHPSLETRQKAYLRVMSTLGLSVPSGYETCYAVEKRVAGLLADPEPPTALMCYSDDTARRAIRVLGERGLRVPEDMSVVGIDDLETPPGYPLSDLTSVFVPHEEMGACAAKLLCERIKEPDRPFQHVMLPEHLVVRESTTAPRTGKVEQRAWKNEGETSL